MAAAQTPETELAEHERAYLFLLDSVIKKSPADPSTKSGTLRKIRDYLSSRISSTDEFIDHIPEFASMIGVPEKQLAAFIGANFLKALQFIQKSKPEAGADTAPSAGEGEAPILDELASLGFSWNPAHRFVEIDYGLMKIVRPDREILPRSHAEYYGAASPASISPVATAETQPEPKAGPRIITVASTRQKKEEPEVAPHETPIIEEILKRFGPILHIRGKLVPSDGIEDEAESAEPILAEPEPAIAAPRQEIATEPPPRKELRESVPERPLIDEIIEKFGAVLSITRRLEPDSGIDEADEAYDSAEGEEVFRQGNGPASAPLSFALRDYNTLVQIVHSFQKSGDREAYAAWLNEADPIERAVLRLRGLIQQERGGASTSWEQEYAKMARFLNVHESGVRDLRIRIERFESIQRSFNEMTRVVRGKPALVNAVRSSWGQIRELFEEPASEHELVARLKILLLQIDEDAPRIELFRIIEPYLQKIGRIFVGE